MDWRRVPMNLPSNSPWVISDGPRPLHLSTCLRIGWRKNCNSVRILPTFTMMFSNHVRLVSIPFLFLIIMPTMPCTTWRMYVQCPDPFFFPFRRCYKCSVNNVHRSSSFYRLLLSLCDRFLLLSKTIQRHWSRVISISSILIRTKSEWWTPVDVIKRIVF